MVFNVCSKQAWRLVQVFKARDSEDEKDRVCHAVL